MAGWCNSIGKWVAGRVRPFHDESSLAFHPFTHGWRGLLSNKNLCFPSGHATLAFATAFGLGILLPSRYRWWFVVGAALVGVRAGDGGRALSQRRFCGHGRGAGWPWCSCVPWGVRWRSPAVNEAIDVPNDRKMRMTDQNTKRGGRACGVDSRRCLAACQSATRATAHSMPLHPLPHPPGAPARTDGR